MILLTQPLVNDGTSDADSKHLAINDKFTRRAITLIALRTTARLYKFHGVRVISRWHLVKVGPWIHLSEATTMDFISKNTSIPVPKVYSSFVYKGFGYILMERIRAKPLPAVWHKLSEKSRQDLLDQLKCMFEELRALEPPKDVGVQNCVGGSLQDTRIRHCQTRFGPFKTVQDFHLWARDGFQVSSIKEGQEDGQELKEMIIKQDGPWPPPVFTHGDLNPFNILVFEDGKVASIIDWEFSGWYPHYWEYASAWYGNRLRTYWQDSLVKFLEPYPDDLKMDIVRQKWFGDF